MPAQELITLSEILWMPRQGCRMTFWSLIYLLNKIGELMNRRDILKQSAGALILGLGSQFLAPGAFAMDCATTPHMNGYIPVDANAALSSTGQFHHFHYLHVPQVILQNPPRAGWNTITSMMSPELGIDPFFFRPAETRKQFHCHQVSITRAELQGIAAGQEVQVLAYIRSGGIPRRNHTFVFNAGGLDPRVSLERRREEIRQLARQNNLQTQSVKCDTRLHRGVTVFSREGDRVVASARELEALKGY
jgi:hypothetical protein